jgi:hypothetical protein
MSKTWPEQNRANNVLQIRSPTLVGCRRVIRAKWVMKAILAVPNAPVAPLAKRVRVPMALAKHVRWVNLVHPMTILLTRAYHVLLGLIKQLRAKHLVCRAFRARTKTVPVQPNVKIAALADIKMHRATTLV